MLVLASKKHENVEGTVAPLGPLVAPPLDKGTL